MEYDGTAAVANANDSVMTLDKLEECKRLLERTPPAGWDGRIHENASLVKTKSRPRTWRERLFSRPWRPMRKITTWQEPDSCLYRVRLDTGRHTIFAHPATAKRLRDEIRQEPRSPLWWHFA